MSEKVENISDQVMALDNGVSDLVKQEMQGAFNVLASSFEERLDKRMDEKEASTRIKVPQPPKFNGSRDKKEINNFLWCVERYFDALRVEDDAKKITTASMYLVDDAILWWSCRQTEVKKGLCQIRTWDEFKVDFKKQFYPDNAEEVALKKLWELRHTGTVKNM
ncbi:uncharacterized protein LOC141631599 [Silene latifolia]|uniref:uncharacterized protein LOC141631599 n=1 Tax=Silene latifolia TaxID=37657 RepID=UPI003D7811CA